MFYSVSLLKPSGVYWTHVADDVLNGVQAELELSVTSGQSGNSDLRVVDNLHESVTRIGRQWSVEPTWSGPAHAMAMEVKSKGKEWVNFPFPTAGLSSAFLPSFMGAARAPARKGRAARRVNFIVFWFEWGLGCRVRIWSKVVGL
jgi:hypothetical protein